MFSSAIGQLKSKEQPRNRFAPAPEMPRRILDGASPATAPQSINLYQPQDGATTQRRRVTDIGSHLLKLAAGEPEDARLTGGTRSLMRRLSGLNLVHFTMPAGARSGMQPRSVKQQLTNVNVA